MTLKGSPLAKAEIQFNPANVNRKTVQMATATIRDDGTYELTTLVGENAVTLSAHAQRRNTELQYTSRTIDLKEGENTFDLSLP